MECNSKCSIVLLKGCEELQNYNELEEVFLCIGRKYLSTEVDEMSVEHRCI
jgi:hypothetical protein